MDDGTDDGMDDGTDRWMNDGTDGWINEKDISSRRPLLYVITQQLYY